MSFRPNIDWSMQARIKGVDTANGSFAIEGNAPELVGRANLGLQLFNSNGFDLRLEYGLTVGGGYVSQTPSARVSYRF